jgi:hypothetical protein
MQTYCSLRLSLYELIITVPGGFRITFICSQEENCVLQPSSVNANLKTSMHPGSGSRGRNSILLQKLIVMGLCKSLS